MQRPRAFFTRVGVPLLLLGAAIVATWPVALRGADGLPGDLGDPLLNTWILAWDADRILDGLRGLWNAPIFYPALGTLTWSEHLLGIAVPLAPLQWIGGNPVLVYNTALVLSYALAAAGGYVLVRELGLARPAAIVGAFACAFAPYRADQTTHLQVLMMGWAPLALAALHRLLRTGTVAAAAACGMAFALLALSNTYYLFFFAWPLAIVWLAGLARPLVPRRKLLAGAATAAAVVAALVGPALFAYWRTRQSLGLARAWDEIADLSARAADYVSVAQASRLWHGVLPVAPAEHALFPGLVILGLAVTGVIAAVRRPALMPPGARHAAWVYAAVAALAAWGTFGPRAGLYAVALQVVPGLDALRMVTRLVAVVSLALAVLAAAGAHAIVAGRSRRVAFCVAALLSGAVFAEGFGAPLHMVSFDPRLPAEKRPMYRWLRDQPAGGVLELPIAGPALGEHTLLYQYATLIHRHPIVNGYSGTGSALQDFLASRNSPIYEPGRLPDLLSALRGMGVRYVVAHPRWIASETRANWLRHAMEEAAGHVETDFHGGDAIAWRLTPAPPDRPQALQPRGLDLLPPGSFTVSASRPGEALLGDRDLGTSWTTGEPQRGGEWVRVELISPIDVRQIDLSLGWRRVHDYPRGLQVEWVAEDGRAHVAYSGSTLPRLLPALLLPGPAVRITIPMPPNRAKALLLRQTQSAPTFWSIDELRVWGSRP